MEKGIKSLISRVVVFTFLLILSGAYVNAADRILFDDFNQGNSRNAFGGYWYTYNDKADAGEGKSSSQISPSPYYPTRFGFNNSEFCAHFVFDVTTSEAANPYSVFECTIANGDVNAYADLSAYTGLGFWLKGKNVTSFPLRFGYNNKPGLDSGIESGGITPRETTLGSVTTNWKYFIVPFSQFQVPLWVGTTAGFDGVDTNGQILFDPYSTENKWDKIRAFAFYMQPPVTKGEIFIDDISFVSAPVSLMNVDSDGDTYSDYIEIAAGTDPHDASIYPAENVFRDANHNGILDSKDDLFIKEVKVAANPSIAGIGTDIIVSFSGIVSDLRSKIVIDIFNTSGGKIFSFSSSMLGLDTMVYHWNGTDTANKKVRSGLYMIRAGLSNNASLKPVNRTVIVQ